MVFHMVQQNNVTVFSEEDIAVLINEGLTTTFWVCNCTAAEQRMELVKQLNTDCEHILHHILVFFTHLIL